MNFNTWRHFTTPDEPPSLPIQPIPPLPKKETEREKHIKRITQLEKEVDELKNTKLIDRVDDFVDDWFEKNKDEVDIGNVKVGPFEVDLLPDEMEKHIYKKSMKILLTMLGELTNR